MEKYAWSGKIAAGSVTSGKLASGSVVADKIAKYAVPDQVLVSGCSSGATELLLFSLLSASHH